MTDREVRVLIGGIGLPWRRDLDLGRLLVDALDASELGEDVAVEDLSYSAHRVMHTLQARRPQKLVLVAATSRGRRPGDIVRYTVDTVAPPDPEDVAIRLGESVGGVIDLDHTLVVNRHFGTLPATTVVIEVEAGDESFGTGYSEPVDAVVPRILELIRQET
ncbi:MAG: hypothetical protein ACLGHX_09665 [Acidimicrobiia bacterium]